MSMTFPDGPGVAQAGGAGRMVMLGIRDALVKNEPETDGPSDFARPQPADEGGTDTAGWVKTADYENSYYGGSDGPWRQV